MRRGIQSLDATTYLAGVARTPPSDHSDPALGVAAPAAQGVPGAASPRVRLGVGAVIVVVLLALAATVAIALLRGAGPAGESVQLSGDSGGVTESAEPFAGRDLYVHVFGAARAPGLYRLSDGARVVDAVAAAGGFTDEADHGAVNLARLLGDGEQLYLPAVGETAADTGAAHPGAAVAGDGRVNLNTASAADLDALPRIGPAMAQRIVAWRDANGRFTSVEDLLAVPGIGEKTLENLRGLVTV